MILFLHLHFQEFKIKYTATIQSGPAEGDSIGTFKLDGVEFIDGGPAFKFSPAISMVVN